MNIQFKDEALGFINKLSVKLLEKGYFSTNEYSERYVSSMLDFIQSNITVLSKESKSLTYKRKLKVIGKLYYLVYNSNKRTSWYIYFIKKDDRFVVLYISNNHLEGHYIRGLR